MTAELAFHRAGPGVTVQDLGRSGFLAQGLSRGGAADPIALTEGAALLGQSPDLAAIEIALSVVEVETTAPLWIALTGAPKRATRDRMELRWNASHLLQPGERLHLGPAPAGTFAYLHVAGGIAVPHRVGGRGAHLAAGLGVPLSNGARLPIGPDPLPTRISRHLSPPDRFNGGTIRMLTGPQTALFPDAVLERFLSTPFSRTAWGNRQGVKLGFEGEGFSPSGGLKLVSEVIVPGDIQVTGDGTPYALGVECQTIGGYPRIGTVVPQDLARVLQATPGSPLQFQLVSLPEALSDHHTPEALVERFSQQAKHLEQDLHHTHNLLSHNLISGVEAGYDDYHDMEQDT